MNHVLNDGKTLIESRKKCGGMIHCLVPRWGGGDGRWFGASSANRKRHLIRRCSAKAKSTGEQCQQFAMSNGKCRFHGGRTPKAAGWHRPRWPNGSAPNAEEKLNCKLRDLDERFRERRALETGLAMLDDDRTKDTAKASIVRAFLADAVQRRGEDDANLEPHEMSAAQINAGARKALIQLELIRREAEDAEIVPAPRGVFD